MRCSHVGDDGDRCEVPEQFVDPETGYCHAHGPGADERMAERGRQGGRAAARMRKKREGLDSDELPALDGHEAAEEWCDRVGRAVAEGRLRHNAGSTILRAVREWRESHDAGEVEDRLEALEQKIAAAKRGDLEVVE